MRSRSMTVTTTGPTPRRPSAPLAQRGQQAVDADADAGRRTFWPVKRSTKPVIAPATGDAAELALAAYCHQGFQRSVRPRNRAGVIAKAARTIGVDDGAILVRPSRQAFRRSGRVPRPLGPMSRRPTAARRFASVAALSAPFRGQEGDDRVGLFGRRPTPSIKAPDSSFTPWSAAGARPPRRPCRTCRWCAARRRRACHRRPWRQGCHSGPCGCWRIR